MLARNAWRAVPRRQPCWRRHLTRGTVASWTRGHPDHTDRVSVSVDSGSHKEVSKSTSAPLTASSFVQRADRHCWLCDDVGHHAADCPKTPTTAWTYDPATHRPLHRPVMLDEVVAWLTPARSHGATLDNTAAAYEAQSATRAVPPTTNRETGSTSPAITTYHHDPQGDRTTHRVIVDATFGCGGHTRALLQRDPHVTVVAVDRDPTAVSIATGFAEATQGRVVPIHGRFGNLEDVLGAHGYGPGSVDGIVMDIGVSSVQLDTPERGFSFRSRGPLDMRMDPNDPTGITAADVVNAASETQLAQIIHELSDEKRAKGIAAAIVSARRQYGAFKTTAQLAAVVASASGASSGIHPATRTFQALRMFVNDELSELDGGCVQAARLLRPGGRLAVVTFHSLELHTVRRFARRTAKSQAVGEMVGGRFTWRPPCGPTPGEVASNPRARSATLMAGEKVFDAHNHPRA
eukprot:m.9896 g.9896  ORF g.9896 m.9896 type:complete len:463 (+) comp2686_c0_seq1:212-1600(+)